MHPMGTKKPQAQQCYQQSFSAIFFKYLPSIKNGNIKFSYVLWGLWVTKALHKFNESCQSAVNINKGLIWLVSNFAV